MKFNSVLISILTLFLMISLAQCNYNQEEETEEPNSINKESKSKTIPQEVSDCDGVLMFNSDCRHQFTADKYCGSQCMYWEDKYWEFLERDPKAPPTVESVSSDYFLEMYLKEVYGFSTLNAAKESWIKNGKLKRYELKNAEWNEINRNESEVKIKSNNSNWTEKDRIAFQDDCKRGIIASNSGLTDKQSVTYCDCMLEKIELTYPDKYSKQDLDWMKKIAKDCLAP